jgi:hypothetical protein
LTAEFQAIFRGHVTVGSVDGLLMPTRKDQPLPPLRDFDQPAK